MVIQCHRRPYDTYFRTYRTYGVQYTRYGRTGVREYVRTYCTYRTADGMTCRSFGRAWSAFPPPQGRTCQGSTAQYSWSPPLRGMGGGGGAAFGCVISGRLPICQYPWLHMQKSASKPEPSVRPRRRATFAISVPREGSVGGGGGGGGASGTSIRGTNSHAMICV